MKVRALLRTLFIPVFFLLLVGTVVYMLVSPEKEDARIREELGDPLAFVTDTARTPWASAEEDGTLHIYHEDCYGQAVLRLPESVNGITVTDVGNAFSTKLAAVERVILPATVTSPDFDNTLSGWTALRELLFREGCVDFQNLAVKASESLEAVYIPKSLERIGWTFLREGEGNPTLYYAGTEEEWLALGANATRLSNRYTVVFEAVPPAEWLESTK